jgi:nucleoside-diphosphate-sugar epimerase
VVGVDSFTDYYPRPLKDANLAEAHKQSGFELVESDLAEAPLVELVEEADGVFHLAAQPGVRGSWGETFAVYARDNVIATQRVFEAAVQAGRRVAWASSSSVYGNAESYPTSEDVRPSPISPYGVTKLSCENLAAAYGATRGLDAVALRYFTVYGPRQRPDMAFARIVNALADGSTFHVFGTGEQTRDVTYVADAVSATLGAMERAPAGAVYNVGGGSETTLLEVIRLAEQLSGRSLDLRYVDSAVGDVRRTSADTSAARVDLDWEPRFSLREGLVAHLKANGLVIV